MHDEEIETYLSCNLERLDEITEQVVKLIPSIFLYVPEIYGQKYQLMRSEIFDLEQKSRFKAYHSDSAIRQRLFKLRLEYTLALEELSEKKRMGYRSQLLESPIEEQAWSLFHLIKRHKLLGYLRKYR